MNADLIPAVGGEPRPDGYIGIVDQAGNRWWLSQDVLTRQPADAILTDQQIERVRAFKDAVAEHDRTTLDQTLANFRRDVDPEREIRLWERIARVYRAELGRRSHTDAAERKLLFAAIMACSFGAENVRRVLLVAPEAANLPNLSRVIDSFME